MWWIRQQHQEAMYENTAVTLNGRAVRWGGLTENRQALRAALSVKCHIPEDEQQENQSSVVMQTLLGSPFQQTRQGNAL